MAEVGGGGGGGGERDHWKYVKLSRTSVSTAQILNWGGGGAPYATAIKQRGESCLIVLMKTN